MPDDRTNAEVIRDTLLQMDPEIRAEVAKTMKVLRDCPHSVAIRVLASHTTRPFPFLIGATGA